VDSVPVQVLPDVLDAHKSHGGREPATGFLWTLISQCMAGNK